MFVGGDGDTVLGTEFVVRPSDEILEKLACPSKFHPLPACLSGGME